jgi:hypothetical protein
MKTFNISIITAFIVMMIVSITVDAKPSSFGGRSSGSGSSSSSTSRSYSSPGTTYSRSTGSSASSSSSNRALFGGRSTSTAIFTGTAATAAASNSNPKPIVVTRDKQLSNIGNKGATGSAAGLLYKDFQTKSKPVSPQVVLSPTDVNRVFSPQYRTERRQTYYEGYIPHRSTHMPSTSNYGPWDALMFAALLDNLGDRQMYYNHQDEPGFQQWRTDANLACQKGDKDVCDKLVDLDREMVEYKNKGIKPNPSYITPGIDSSIYTAQNIDTSGLVPIRICSGSVASDYSRFTSQITKFTKVKTNTIVSNGSADNIAEMANGLCDMSFVQDDVANTTPNLVKVMTLNQLEIVGLACTTSYEKLKDVPANTTVYVGSDQTGSLFTYNQLVAKIPSLAKLKLDTSKTSLQAANDVVSAGGCVFSVSTPESPLFKAIDATGKMKLVPINAEDFADGKPSYQMVIVMDSHYKNLINDKFKGFGTNRGTDTLAVKTSLITPQSWIDSNKTAFDILMLNSTALKESVQ